MTNCTTKEENKKVCNLCKKNLPGDLNHFYRHKGGKLGLSGRCKVCKGGSYGIQQMQKVLGSKDGYKFCGKCKIELPLDNEHFYRKKSNVSGWGSWCKKCWGTDYGVHSMNSTYESKEGYKFCNTCKEELPFDDFHKSNDILDGFTTMCKKCSATRSKKYTSQPKVRIHIREYRKKWRKVYYSTPAGIAMNAKHVNIRRSRKANVEYNYSVSIWEDTLEYFKGECAYCGKEDSGLNQEHVIPLSKGGCYTKHNIIPACQFCNTSKHNKDLMEWYPNQSCFSEERLLRIEQYLNKALVK